MVALVIVAEWMTTKRPHLQHPKNAMNDPNVTNPTMVINHPACCPLEAIASFESYEFVIPVVQYP